MIAPSLHALPGWSVAAIMLAHAAGGLAVGALYFHAVWWNVGLLTQRRLAIIGIVAAIGRFLFLGALLWLVATLGAAPLLATTAGMVAGRAVVLRRLGSAA